MSEGNEKWEAIALGDLSNVVTKGSSPRWQGFEYVEEGITFVRSQNIGWGKLRLDDVAHLPAEFNLKEKKSIIKDGDLLLNLVGASIGRACIATPELEGANVNQAVAVIRIDHAKLDSKFALNYLLSPTGQGKIHGTKVDVARANFSLADARALKIPLPPLPEQRRIVARIEELFSRLDAGVAALRHAKAQLQRYRQSVLAAAVTGQLTQAWREQHPDTEPAEELLKRILEQRYEQWNGRGKYKEPVAPTSDQDLPENWVSATSDQLVHFVTSGSRGWAEYYSEEGAIFLRIGNLEHEDIALDLDDIQRVMPPEGAEGSRTRVQTNDILISITADVGMVALVDTDIGEAYINQHVALARPSDEVNPRFLAWLLASKPTKAQWKLLQRGATKVGLGLDDIRAVQLGLPPIAEQDQIVAEVESRTTAIDHLEAELDRQITRANRLRQSTLAAAFSGSLTT